MENKQLFEKQANSYNPFFPLVRLEDIIETISDKSIQWIINNYNHLYVEYSESKAITRNKVPALLRRKGLWITYNANDELITEYFKSDNKDVTNYVDWTRDENWERFDKLSFVDGSITYQHLSEAVKQLLGSGNTITNYPDDEDLTVKDGTLKLKDRDYDVANFSGLGRIILRKNIMVADKKLKNILTQDMINQSNTIYEIRYDFDLNGAEITIPEGCVLDFQGGRLSNGTIFGTNTGIKSEPCQIFDLDLNLVNTFNVPFMYSEWYGAKGDGVNDDSYAINKALSSPISTLMLLDSVYSVSNTTPIVWNVDGNVYGANIIIPDNKTIIGSSTSDYTRNSTIKVSKDANSDIAVYVSSRQLEIKNVRVVGSDRDDGTYSCWRLIVTQKGVARLLFEKVHARFCRSIGMDIDCYGLVFNSCSVADAGNFGIYLHAHGGHNTSAVLLRCVVTNTKGSGYILHNMDYCSLVSCATDNSGYDINNINVDTIQAAYRFIGVRGVTMQGCGCEAVYKILDASLNTRGLNVNSCYFLTKTESLYPEGFDFSKVWNLEWITNSSVNNSLVGRAFSGNKLISATKDTKIVFNDCYLFEKERTESVKLTSQCVVYVDENYEEGKSRDVQNVTVINNANYYDGYTTLDAILSSYNDSKIRDIVVGKVNDGYLDGKTIKNIDGKFLIGNNTNAEYAVFYLKAKNIIRNCSDLIFEHIEVRSSNFNDGENEGLNIVNSKLTFNGCHFLSNPPSSKIIKAKNSTIILNNCTFTPRYGSSPYMEDYIETENCLLIIKNKDKGTTEERLDFIPLYRGYEWYDTTLKKPTYHINSVWVDATGANV